MQLFLTNSRPWDTDYCLEGGDIIYKVSSPWRYVPRKTMIQRVQPAGRIESYDGSHDDTYEDMAVIEYHLFMASKVRFQSYGRDAKNVGVDELFKTTGWRYKKGEDQVFFGPDRKEYTWRMSGKDCELFCFRGSTWTQIASFQRRELGIIGKARRAVLNITEENETLRDLILLTFVYLERLRVESYRQPMYMAAGSVGAGN